VKRHIPGACRISASLCAALIAFLSFGAELAFDFGRITVDGRVVLEQDSQLVSPVTIGIWTPWVDTSSKIPVTLGATERLSNRQLRRRISFGEWVIEDHAEVYPEKSAIRRWFEFEWTGEGRERFENFWMAFGKLKPTENGLFIQPGEFPARRHSYADMATGETSEGAPLGASPTFADVMAGLGLTACVDCLTPYADRGQTYVTRRADGVLFHARMQARGFAERGKKQRVGDFWLVIGKGDAEGALRGFHDWRRLVGQVPPEDRPGWVSSLSLYSMHPAGRDNRGEGGFAAASEYLTHLEALGVNALWIRPVEAGPCYLPEDYRALQAAAGSETDFRAYIRAAHAKGMRVLRDAVSHGGATNCIRAVEHPDYLCRNLDGKVSAPFWTYDLNNADWQDEFTNYIGWATARYGLDGWRLDAPLGSRFCNWSEAIGYDRASFAQHLGGVGMMRKIRAAMRQANPDSADVSEAGADHCAVLCDAIGDQFLCHAVFQRFAEWGAVRTVRELRRWLEDQRYSDPPGTLRMRYPECHDSYRCDWLWGRAAANALMAACVFMDGFPMVMEESEDGAFEAYRRLLALRRALPELSDGKADYLSVSAPDGVFAVSRDNGTTSSIAYVNFNPQPVKIGSLELRPFGYAVVRTKGDSVESRIAAVEPRLNRKAVEGKDNSVAVELREVSGAAVTSRYEIAQEKVECGVRYRVVDFGGLDPEKVRLTVRLPMAEKWFAHAAEGTFESPFVVRHRNVGTYRMFSREFEGAVRWDSRYHPFGFTREHATVGGVCGEMAYECSGFTPRAVVEIRDRLKDEMGLCVTVSGVGPADFSVVVRQRTSDEALAFRDPGTGDPRLVPVVGGWLYDDGELRLRMRRTGSIAGVWTRSSDGGWERRLESFGMEARDGTAPLKPRSHWDGRDPDVKAQDFSPATQANFHRDPCGRIHLEFDSGRLRGVERNRGEMSKPLWMKTKYELGDGQPSVKFGFLTYNQYDKKDYSFGYVAKGLSGASDVLIGLTYDGARPQAVLRNGRECRYVYHDRDTEVKLPTHRYNWLSAQFAIEGRPRWIASSRKDAAASCFFRDVVNAKRLDKAKLTVSGLGVFEAYVNGVPVGEDFLKPGFTDGRKTRYSFSYDVTGLMVSSSGAVNRVSAQVTDGWWCDGIVRNQGRRRAFYAVLDLAYDDGTADRVVTDERWLSADAGPVRRASIFDGEDYDARIDVGWMREGRPESFEASVVNGEFCGVVVPAGEAKVCLRRDLAMSPVELYLYGGVEGAADDRFGQVRVLSRYEDGDGIELRPGETLVADFGQNSSAVPELVFSGARGISVKCRPGEALNDGFGERSRRMDGPAGSVYRANLREARAEANYTFSDERKCVYRPSFSFFGYRYLSITADGPVVLSRVRSIPVTSIRKEMEIGSLVTGNGRVNKLLANIRWGMLSNYLSVPTDCPQRDERIGWTADTQVFAPAATWMARVDGFLSQWMGSVRDAQWDDGAVPSVVPPGNYGRDVRRIGWGDAVVVVPHTLWKQYGDVDVVRDNWTAMERYMSLIGSRGYDERYQWADWMSGENLASFGDKAFEKSADGTRRVRPDVARYWRFLGCCHLLQNAKMMLEMARGTGKTSDVSRYEDRMRRERAVVRSLLGSDGLLPKEFADMQTPLLFALKTDIFEDESSRQEAIRALRADIMRKGCHLSTGFLGTAILMDTLSNEAESPDLAYSLLFQDSVPSWLYAVDQGATTVWERWDAYDRKKGFWDGVPLSLNHYAYGAVMAWFYETVAGIRAETDHPGFERFVLSPKPDRRLGSVKVCYRSAAGMIESEWAYDADGKWKWRFAVPKGTAALVKLTGESEKLYSEGQYEVER